LFGHVTIICLVCKIINNLLIIPK